MTKGKWKNKIVSLGLTLAMTTSLFAGMLDRTMAFDETEETIVSESAAAETAQTPESAPDAGFVEINTKDFSRIKDALEGNQNVRIKLTGDVSQTYGSVQHGGDSTQVNCQIATDILTLGLMEIMWQDFNQWRPTISGYSPINVINLGKGIKILDLNGYDFCVYNPGINQERSCLFIVGEGTDFTIKDDTNEGEVFLDGYIYDACDYDYFKYEQMNGYDQQRDLIRVEGGKFTLNGGKLAGGRSKNEAGFVTANTQIKGENGYDWVSGYTGSATKYVNSTAIDLESGEVVINRGTVKGRGFEKILNGHEAAWNSPNIKNGVIEAKSGKLTINEGYIYATGGSDCLQIADDVEVIINAGKFSLHRNDALFCGRKNGYGTNRIYTIEDEPLFGQVGIPAGAISDPDNTWVEYYTGKGKGKVLAKESEWRDEFKSKVENKHGADDYEPGLVIYPNGGYTTLTAVKSPNEDIPELDPNVSGQLSFRYDTESRMSFIPEEVRRAAGWERKYEFFAYDWDGKQMKVNSSKDFEVYKHDEDDFNTEQTWEIALGSYLADNIGDYFKLGKTFTIGCILTEVYHGARDYEIVTIAGKQFKTAHLNAVQLYETPEKKKVVTKGETVTLKASALFASNVKWYFKEKNGSTSEINSQYYTNYQDRTTTNGTVIFESTLTYQVNSNGTIYCTFSNALGSKKCETAVGYPVSFTNTETTEVTIYKSLGGSISQPIDGTLEDGMYFKWYYWWSPVEDSTTVAYTANGNILNIPKDNEALYQVSSDPNSLGNVYLCELRQKKNGEDIYIATSPAIKVNYVDTTLPSREIPGLVISFGKGLYVGAEAPTKETSFIAYGATGKDVETRAYISSLTVEGAENGIIKSATPTLRLRVKSSNNYFYFKGKKENAQGYTNDYYLWCNVNGDYVYAKMVSETAYYVDIIIKYDGTDEPPLTTAPDLIISGKKEFTFTKGEYFSTMLDFNLVMSDYALSKGEKHYISEVAKYPYYSNYIIWPDGINLAKGGPQTNEYGVRDWLYIFRGTVPETAVEGKKYCYFAVKVMGDPDYPDGRTYYVRFDYTILPAPEKTSAQIKEDLEETQVHQHVMGDWAPIGGPSSPNYDTHHQRVCDYFESTYDEYGNEFEYGAGCYYAEIEPHSLEEVGVVEEATKDKKGKIKYRCSVCGAEVTKEYELNVEQRGVTIDVNMGAKVINNTTFLAWDDGEYFTLPDLSGIAHPDKKIFTGWKVTADHDPDKVFAATKPGDQVLVDCDITCTAVWISGTLVSSVKLNKSSISLATNATQKMKATVDPSNATNNKLTWTSSDESVASVDQNGKITAHTYGKVVITATAKDGSGKSASVTVQTRFYDVNGSSNKNNANYQYFFTPVYWAADRGITKGYGGVYFGVGEECTRGDYMLFLYRLAGTPNVSTSAAKTFSDLSGKYAKGSYLKAIAWGVESGITNGYSDGTFGADKPVTRKDAMIMLYRFAGKPAFDKTKEMTFTDVVGVYKKNSDTYKAIEWAYNMGITNGYSDGTFGAKNNVKREDMITFMYRYAKKYDKL